MQISEAVNAIAIDDIQSKYGAMNRFGFTGVLGSVAYIYAVHVVAMTYTNQN